MVNKTVIEHVVHVGQLSAVRHLNSVYCPFEYSHHNMHSPTATSADLASSPLLSSQFLSSPLTFSSLLFSSQLSSLLLSSSPLSSFFLS